MRAIPGEIRGLIVAAKLRGEKESEIAVWMNVSKAAVGKIWKLHRDKGNTHAAKNPGRPTKMTKEMMDAVADAIKRKPDITLQELIEELSLPVRKSQLNRLVARLGFNFRKKRYSLKTSSGKMSSGSVRNGGRA
jgi:transposase